MAGQSHTAGPWKLFFVKSGPKEGQLLGIGTEAGEGVGDYRGGLWGDGEEKLANARLIAAAPCMANDGAFLLARLAEFEQTMESESGDAAVRDWHGHVVPALAQFRAAISKATGEGGQ